MAWVVGPLRRSVRQLTSDSYRRSGRYGYSARVGELWRQCTSGYPSCREGSRRGVSYCPTFSPPVARAKLPCRYATIGAVLMSKKVTDGIRDGGGFWKHGHTYQVGFPRVSSPIFLTRVVGTSNRVRRVFGRSKSHQGRWVNRTVPIPGRISSFSTDRTAAGT